MGNEICLIKINNDEQTDLYPDIISVEVEDDARLAGVFNIRLAIRLQKDGTWTLIDDERLVPWNKVSISAGFEDNVVEVLSGYITHVKPYFDTSMSLCYLDIKGMDGSVLMNTEEKIKSWPNKKDSDIADRIFKDYGFTPEVEDTMVVYDDLITTIIQRETDIQFLKRLALRNGFECFVQNSTGYFRPPQLSSPPQKILAIQFGGESNLSYFHAEINSLQPTTLEMHQLDPLTKDNQDVAVDSTLQKRLGKTPALDLYKDGVKPGKIFVKHTCAAGQQAMKSLCQGLFDEAEWIIQGEGEIIGLLYQDVVKARELITIKGVGNTYSGMYYVTRVKHVFSRDGYTQHFSVKRNALHLDGSEDFSGGGLLSGIL